MNSNMMTLIFPLIIFGFVLLIGAIAFLVIKNSDKDKKNIEKRDKKDIDAEDQQNDGVKRNKENVKKEDVFKFMEFDKIEDDMIVQDNGKKYTMILKCKGINYDLMSEVEQLSVEEGFITFLNTLRYPIQLYVQAQTIDLKKTIAMYKERLNDLGNRYEEELEKYNRVVNSLDSSEDEIRKAEADKASFQNVYEYAADIVKYVDKLSLNKSLLQRNFYVIFSYYSSEITAGSNFTKEEIQSICYNELYTRAQAISSGLSACSVSCELLHSNDIAELLYSSYNRDDKNIMNIHQALDSGFYRLYSTSKDAFQKRNEMLNKNIKEEAKLRAIDALKKAIDEGKYVSQDDIVDEYDEAVGKQAKDIVESQQIAEDVKAKAKRVLADEYKAEKKQKIEERNKKIKEAQKVIDDQKNPKSEEQKKSEEKTVEQKNSEENNNSKTGTNSSEDDLIV